MKKIAVCLGAAVVIAALSCDPIGTGETKVWVTGMVYNDTFFTAPQDSVVIMLEMHPDSFNVTSSDVMTNANGLFMMEIQVWPDLSEEGTTGYSMPALIFFGLSAHYKDWVYVYRTLEQPFIVEIGDTLHLWPIGYGNI